MKCGLKDGFFSILLISLAFASEESEVALLVGEMSGIHRPGSTPDRLQDSFPDDGNSENRLHRIVKKQMADVDFKEMNKQKLNSCGDGDWFKGKSKTKRAAKYYDSPKQCTNTQGLNNAFSEDFLGKIKKNLLTRKKRTETNDQRPNSVRGVVGVDAGGQDANSFLKKTYIRLPDKKDSTCYYECEEKPFGCMKLKHKKCPNGQIFSHRYLKCMKLRKKVFLRSKRLGYINGKKLETIEIPSDEPEPSNEWLDASQGSNQKVPPEFKAKKAPGLKIYHLKVKRTLSKVLKKRHAKDRKKEKLEEADNLKKNKARQHSPRSFLIRINKKEGKNNLEESIAENDENDSDEDDEEDEESDEDDEEEESDEEDEETEEEQKVENKDKLKSNAKESFKDLIKSAKAAVTNRVRFNEPSEPEFLGFPSMKSKKTGETKVGDKNKKVLIDANIKVDRTIGNALKQILKSKEKDKESNNRLMVDDDDNFIENNPRVKRYFLANRERLMQT